MGKYAMKSAFASDMERFVAHKRALGYRYDSEAEVLGKFDRFCVAHDISENLLSREIAEKWGVKQDGEQQKSHSNRVTVLRQFALFLEKEGREAYVLPLPISPSPGTFVPHIFTRHELAAIFQAIDRVCEASTSSLLMVWILPILFRLMYACGLRVSEACGLKKRDVDLTAGVLTVIGAKGDKDRLVPVSPAIMDRLRVYLSKMAYICPRTEYVFPNRSGDKVAEVTIYARFRRVLFEAGIPHGGRGKGPRLHDVRHTFAIHSLEKMAADGLDLYCALPVLSVYMGHTDVRATERYLRLTEEAYSDVLRRLMVAYGDIAPVAGEGEAQ